MKGKGANWIPATLGRRWPCHVCTLRMLCQASKFSITTYSRKYFRSVALRPQTYASSKNPSFVWGKQLKRDKQMHMVIRYLVERACFRSKMFNVADRWAQRPRLSLGVRFQTAAQAPLSAIFRVGMTPKCGFCQGSRQVHGRVPLFTLASVSLGGETSSVLGPPYFDKYALCLQPTHRKREVHF